MWAAPPRWAPKAMSPLVPALAACLPGHPLSQAVLLGPGVHRGGRTSFVPSTAHVAIQSRSPMSQLKFPLGCCLLTPAGG